MKQTYYITTAIDYVNGRMHIGHAYEKIGADALARYKRMTGRDTILLLGTDENSLNSERRARELEMEPQAYVDEMASYALDLWKKLNISYDEFERTTGERHITAVNDFFMRCYNNGDVYQGTYEGWYCTSCEAFYNESELDEGHLCKIHKIPATWLTEYNYFFRLSKYEQALREYFEQHPYFITPETRKNEIMQILNQGLQDFSISRASMKWGIPVPIDPTQVVYVWFDALICYISGIGFGTDQQRFEHYWPADVHIIGKDITRFHCLYWPAMLMSAGLPLPERIHGHGFIYVRGERMSKTTGNVVDPVTVVDSFGVDPLRYYLLREVPFDRDGDFVWSSFFRRYNADLANDLGNLLNRTVSMINRYRKGIVPEPTEAGQEPVDRELQAMASGVVTAIDANMDALAFSDALDTIWDFVGRANKYVEETAPWTLARDPQKAARLDNVLYNLAESLRLIAHFVYPFIPSTAEQLAAQLGIALQTGGVNWLEIRNWGGLEPGTRVAEKPVPLFPKIDEEEAMQKVEANIPLQQAGH